ncbi:L,D-transpeptidase family protein [Pyxidicoccus fallax]|uniref:L,D-transpeptidase family protein n=1 Tax=Pyxidicoccus fallax TaxID=394095 RepID=A0A848LC62_9BACT|nr:L,D-transpeptidase family protein [Pyxidicoccus fallax]NMO14313.1 L,D-transpeptidase family protein [Pyxidicoccus fallax]NPC82417.1 L,D-transpeptidase family protein [Pyxidicoccus fallax]
MRNAAACLLMLFALSAHAEPPRVAAARKSKTPVIAALFKSAGVAWPPERMYVRAFKHERELEVWAGAKAGPLVKVKTYPFCAASGELGPKRQRGDLQVPEGFYTIDLFNPWSDYHLSMRVSYPNAADKKHKTAADPGGNIFVHGDCVSIGCIAIENEPIQELYVMVLDTRAKTKRDVPIHIFPRRLDAEGLKALERGRPATDPRLAFWRSLQPAYTHFEESRLVPVTSVEPETGTYVVKPARHARVVGSTRR